MTTYTAGDRVRAVDLRNNLPRWGYAVSDTGCRGTTSYDNATGLVVTLDGDSQYAFDGFLAYTTGVTASIRWSITAPPSATGSWSMYPIADTGATGNVEGLRKTAFGDTTEQGSQGSGGAMMCWPQGYVDTGPGGLLQVRFAQLTSDASVTLVKAGSWIRAWKIL